MGNCQCPAAETFHLDSDLNHKKLCHTTQIEKITCENDESDICYEDLTHMQFTERLLDYTFETHGPEPSYAQPLSKSEEAEFREPEKLHAVEKHLGPLRIPPEQSNPYKK